jgi:hypothetical protein
MAEHGDIRGAGEQVEHLDACGDGVRQRGELCAETRGRLSRSLLRAGERRGRSARTWAHEAREAVDVDARSSHGLGATNPNIEICEDLSQSHRRAPR